ncbi:hypothetical protein Ptr902_01251 [Pyrenophora tritici-repentis]|uniref:Uncharacterized protein n=1 Tax=Pyrenophora tritici-repentis TaxID=45151 RepID=A0A5M9LK63_9PLEO|nr:hypothetical protein PtrV1_01650 [Pyrenophora tritici-repentis]KAF7454382.1 hypothetical protein A1F99_016400 [Pyrenophora tritici-repentis]KAF7577502.1 hypothetical protein PtrM4_017420 [Pyrenophora tritici-repentis]KAI0570908.1 hypothetical protein Alg215_10750 [Pyrenophora tritici-repentis]KAI0581102.1 hypothetical protein Alg130_06775 [Pyrenophora tritici-repentis]
MHVLKVVATALLYFSSLSTAQRPARSAACLDSCSNGSGVGKPCFWQCRGGPEVQGTCKEGSAFPGRDFQCGS